MIQTGNNITSPADPLSKIKIEQLYHKILKPTQDVEFRVRQMRIIRQLNPKQYSLQKRYLPYVVCGLFNPPFRKTENFAYTDYFIIDIDHISDSNLSLSSLRQTIQQDERVMLCFISPSEDGLKLFFRFKERCYDSGLYSIFYKKFVREFSLQYNLNQVIDERTCDVTRACFYSFDTNAYYNPNSVAVEIHAYIDIDNPLEVCKIKMENMEHDKEKASHTNTVVLNSNDPDIETMDRIKSMLNPKLKVLKQSRPVFVPEVLEDIIDDLKKHIENMGIVVNDIINIQYGKKIKMTLGQKKSEINLFYGKRGFSVVQSPKCGTSDELNQLTADIVNTFLNTVTI